MKNLEKALQLDNNDPLRSYREQFLLPKDKDGNPQIYFCGNSLGLQPKTAQQEIQAILTQWSTLGVEAWFEGKTPWIDYTDRLKDSIGRIIGAHSTEVAIANTLSVNLQLLLSSFYQPTPDRYKIIMEKDAFPSDQYIIQSQVRLHGYDPADAIIEIDNDDHHILSVASIKETIAEHGQTTAVILLGGVNYISGQLLPTQQITQWGHAQGCRVGFDLAHAVGNAPLSLHEWGVDFAAWCNYKYLNSGPGAIGGLYVHERYHHDESIHRLEGWWGNKKSTRFLMRDHFDPSIGAEAWVMSTPPLLSIAAIKASLALFDSTSIAQLRAKSEQMTALLLDSIADQIGDQITVITPGDFDQRGCQTSLAIKGADKALFSQLIQANVICDWREPNIIRISPVPLYNTYEEIVRFADILRKLIQE